MTKRLGAHQRREQILALLREAGPQGMTVRQVAAACDMPEQNANSQCTHLRHLGLLARVGGCFLLHEHLPPGVAQDAPGVRAPDARPRNNPVAPRGFDPRVLERATFTRTKCQTTFGDVVVPPGTPITVVAAPRGRFEPAPGHVGEFTRQWQEARA